MMNNFVAIIVLALLVVLGLRFIWHLVQNFFRRKENKQNSASGGCSHCH